MSLRTDLLPAADSTAAPAVAGPPHLQVAQAVPRATGTSPDQLQYLDDLAASAKTRSRLAAPR